MTWGESAGRLLAAVDSALDAQLAFLARIVDINSATLNFAGVRRVADEIAAALQSLGFETAWHDTTARLNRAGYLVARRAGNGPRLLLIGHVDTVHPPDGPFQRFERRGDRAVGPGIEDMKNGDAVLVFALRALHGLDLLDGLDLTVLLTGDEENPADPRDRARADLVAAAQGKDAVLSFEPGEPGVAVTSRRGMMGWQLDVAGQAGHSGLLGQPDLGLGAIYEAARILDGFRAIMGQEARATINPNPIVGGSSASLDPEGGTVAGGGKVNVVAKTLRVRGDLRCLSPAQVTRVQARMRAIVATPLPGTSATLSFLEAMPPMATQPGNERLLTLLSECSVQSGGPPLSANDPVFRGGGDISYVAHLVPACIDGLGGWGGDAHADTEWLDLESFALATRRTALLLARIAQERGLA